MQGTPFVEFEVQKSISGTKDSKGRNCIANTLPKLRWTKTVGRVVRRAGFSPYWIVRSTSPPAKKVTIVMYHSVHPNPGRAAVSPEAFRRQITFIKKNYAIRRLSEIDNILLNEELSDRTVVITFDDGHLDFMEFAFPVLKELGVPCMIFVPTRHIAEINHSQETMMNGSHFRYLAHQELIGFGSHTVDHVNLRQAPRREIERQTIESKMQLEDLVQYPVKDFAYPYGAYSLEIKEILQAAGYERAVSTRWGTLNSYQERMALRRIFFEETDQDSDLRAKIEGDYDWFALLEAAGSILEMFRMIIRGAANLQRQT